ncbi:MAG TPA: adenylate/guanylate cyclase domain-containing protein [Burkholderiales bacterium]|nr:adenylate/guanylate cyclase domain-containing protein [Burkholderiales bacterium]
MAEKTLNVHAMVEWLESARPEMPDSFIASACQQMLAHGIAIARFAVFARTLHPNVAGRGFFWRAEKPTEVEGTVAEHDWMGSDAHLASPIHAIQATGEEIRRHLADPACRLDFAILAELRAEGMTDYYATPLPTITGEKLLASFTTRQPGGFSDAELAALRRLRAPFGRVAEILSLRRKAQNILDAYLGEQTGQKVLAGQIKRGDGEEIRAVIWFCDLRDSTPLADSMSRQAFLALLNQYFECVLGPVQERKGEILRFIGDAALAIFPIGNEPAAVACAKALDAAKDSISRMKKLNASRALPLRFGIGLHLGLVLYGNIGTPTRIEFTVIGAAANEAARIEALCKTLKVDLALSEQVARHVTGGLRSLGYHQLRGVGVPVEIFTPY